MLNGQVITAREQATNKVLRASTVSCMFGECAAVLCAGVFVSAQLAAPCALYPDRT